MPSPGESDAEKFSSETLNELGELHDRLPIPLRYSGDDNDELSVWMRAQEEADVAVERIRGQAYDVAREWVLTEVGREVGSVAHNGPELIQPVERLI